MDEQREDVGKEATGGKEDTKRAEVTVEHQTIEIQGGEGSSVKWEEWINAIRSGADKQKTTDQHQHRDLPKIPKVPNKLRDKLGFTSYYEPSVVSIGPYHYHKSNTNSQIGEMGAVKEKAVKLFFNLNKGERKTSDGQLINNFAKKIKGVGDWYEKDSTRDMDEMEFIKMMFLGGCFIIMFIRCILHSNVEELGMTKGTVKSVQQDILMLENQLPFQVLEVLYTEIGFDKSDLLRILRLYIRHRARGHNWVMQSAGILKSIQGNEEELANFINKIGAAVEPQFDDYKDVKREMGNYIASKRRAWLNEVIRDYLRSPWTIIAFLAGIFLLFLTAVQTYFAAFPHPGNGN
ncbi:hypothetical protein F0562_017542 [Nyssa sinensis]|uniref:Uncharacterized protein n=1 Tax=Nyssa sinensis TaxID=561372 RepID=A0A5J4ZHT3_9ASTE|nr:hypothetical protein F0562_017542 [Nyssa sinensis]